MNLSINARDAMPEGGKLSFSLSHVQASTANKSWQNGGMANLGRW